MGKEFVVEGVDEGLGFLFIFEVVVDGQGDGSLV